MQKLGETSDGGILPLFHTCNTHRGDTKAVRGPMAAGIAGRVYHQLNEEEYFTKQATDAGIGTVAAKTDQ